MEDPIETQPPSSNDIAQELVPVHLETKSNENAPQPKDADFKDSNSEPNAINLKKEVLVQDSIDAGEPQGPNQLNPETDQKNQSQNVVNLLEPNINTTEEGGDALTPDIDINKQNDRTEVEDLSSGSSEDSEPDSVDSSSTTFQEVDEAVVKWETLVENRSLRFPIRTEPRRVYKLDRNFTRFIEDFTSHINWKTELVIDEDTIFNEEIFPTDMVLNEYVPTNILFPSLKELHFIVPQVLDYANRTDCKSFFRQVLGDQSSGFEMEEVVRDHISFLLQSIKAEELESFSLENTDHGMDLCQSDRLTVWECALQTFLTDHSSTLKKINLRTVKLVDLPYTQEDGSTKQDIRVRFMFPKLEELSILLWEKRVDNTFGPDQTNFTTTKADSTVLETYWVHLLQSRALYGELRKLVWMSKEDSIWNDDALLPVFLRNEETLVILHLICGGMECMSEVREMPWDKFKIPGERKRVFRLGARTNCILYSKMVNLKSLYLRRPDAILDDLTLLPPNLEELSLDFVYLHSEDLADCLKKLDRLKKLRLVNNAPRLPLSSLENPDLPGFGYGVNEKVLKVILNHRTLDYVYVLGDMKFLEIPRTDRNRVENNISSFQRFQRFFKRVYCQTSRRYNDFFGDLPPQPSPLLVQLQEIALIGTDGFIIDRVAKD